MRQAQFTKLLTVAMSPELYEKIKRITDEQRISMGAWVREMAEKAFAKSEDKEE